MLGWAASTRSNPQTTPRQRMLAVKNSPSARTVNRSRRQFLVTATAAGGGFALGINNLFGVSPAQAQPAAEALGPEVTAWVVIKPDDTTIIRIARSEMGQGSLTGLA